MRHPRNPGDLEHCPCDECDRFRADIAINRGTQMTTLKEPLQIEGSRMNLVARQDFARRMVGRTVNVYKLGGVRPEDDPDTELFLPLPEYGIVLVTFKPRDQHFGFHNKAEDPDGMLAAILKAGNV